MVIRPGADASARRARRLLIAAGVASTVVVVLSLRHQFFDSNFFALAGAPAILAGEHPYRDFFDPYGVLDAYTAAAMQWLVGYRVVGEFGRQTAFIVAGFVIATHLALTLSRSVVATALAMTVPLVVLAVTPLYHHSKLFFFPLLIWVGWRYLDRPSPGRAVPVGLVAALAFLFRHDYGMYMALGSVLAYGLARIADPASRRARSLITDALAFAAGLAIVLGPWAVVVQRTEGFANFARDRASLYVPSNWSLASAVFRNPLSDMMPPPLPVRPGDISFVWYNSVDAATRDGLARRLGLRVLEQPAEPHGRWRYASPNVNDVALLDLVPHVDFVEGVPFGDLERARNRLPSPQWARDFLRQSAGLVPLVLLAAALVTAWRARRAGLPVHPDVYKMVLAGSVLGAIEQSLFRESGYVVVALPTAAGLSACLLAAASPVARLATGAGLAASGFAAWIWAADTTLFSPSQYGEAMSVVAGAVMASPPVLDARFTYIRECTEPTDHVFVTGPTPYHVTYFSQRRTAAGHMWWPYHWRADPEGEAKSLELLQRQSVPIAISTQKPVLNDLERYPRIQEYMRQHYTAIDGGKGQLLVDTRHRPTGVHAGTGYPCFK
jgi:hypothetical protein